VYDVVTTLCVSVFHMHAMHDRETPALFQLVKFWISSTLVFLFLFDKYCPIIDQLSSKNLSHKLHINCSIIFVFVYI